MNRAHAFSQVAPEAGCFPPDSLAGELQQDGLPQRRSSGRVDWFQGRGDLLMVGVGHGAHRCHDRMHLRSWTIATWPQSTVQTCRSSGSLQQCEWSRPSRSAHCGRQLPRSLTPRSPSRRRHRTHALPTLRSESSTNIHETRSPVEVRSYGSHPREFAIARRTALRPASEALASVESDLPLQAAPRVTCL